MKRFYILFFSGFILFSVLLYLSVWWMLAGVATLVLVTSYRFYLQKLRNFEASIVTLELQVEELESQLDRSIAREQRAAQDATRVREAKQELLTAISHEIRTPMNGVLGMTLLLEESALTTEQQEYTGTILRSGQSLLTTINELLVNDMLEFSKLHQKQVALEFGDFELRDCVEEVLDMFAGKAAEKQLDLLCSIAPNVPVQVFSDHKHIRQVLMNLVENAVKFTHKGEVMIHVECQKPAQGHLPELRFEVRDTGYGVPPGLQSNLFYGIKNRDLQQDPNEQAGLGLVICRKLVEQMQGQIGMTSEAGAGSVFYFNIPVSPGKATVHSLAQNSFVENFAGKKILVVDDNANSRDILSRQLKSWGAVPTVSDSAEKAFDLVQSTGSFDLVIADLYMPFTNGIDLARSVKAKFSEVPFVLLAAKDQPVTRIDRELFVAVLAKPMRQRQLKDQLSAVLTKLARPIEKEIEPGSMDARFAAKFPMRILVAEDNRINQKIALKILAKLGYEASIANNGKEALEMVSDEKYDLILMDVQMPEMDGLEATRMIRTCLDIQPVIMAMTANALQGDRDICIQAGMDDYLSKPIDLNELLTHFEKWGTVIRERNLKQQAC